MNKSTLIYGGVGVVVIGGILYFLVSFLFSPNEGASPVVQNGLGVTDISTTVGTQEPSSETSTNTQTPTGAQVSNQKIFRIAEGPVSNATFIETKNPTTTLARYVLSTNGHVVEIPIDVPGATTKNISNTTIPGVQRTLWGNGGGVAILQYLEGGEIKSASITFPQQSTSSVPLPVKIQFFPDGILDIALSPDAKQAAYLLRTSKGVDGYLANSNGSGSRKVFSIPLAQVLLTWPSQSTLLVQSKSASEASGIVFSVDVATGNTTPVLQATGLIATADPSFTNLIYQSTTAREDRHTSYVHNMRTGSEAPLSFNPLVEKCTWSAAATSTNIMYCASPLLPTPANYTDLWHMGLATMADSVFSYNLTTGASNTVATPGTNQGGVVSDISTIAVSPNGKYILFVTKNDRSLWGVRLAQ